MNIPDIIQLVADATVIDLQQAGGKAGSPATFRGVAYSGNSCRPSGWLRQVVTDTSGLQLPDSLPILAGHTNELDAVVGKGRPYIENGQILVEGTISQANRAGKIALQLAKDGIQLQLSIGSEVHKTELVESGKSVSVNNQNFTAGANGLVVVRAGSLREITLTPIGADGATWAEIKQKYERANNMPPETQNQNTTIENNNLEQNQQNLTAAELRADAAAEAKRIAAIRKVTLGYEDIGAEAIEQGWDMGRVELAVFRASRPSGPSVSGGGRGVSGREVIEARLLCRAGLEAVALDTYGERAVEQSAKAGLNSMADVFRSVCALDGVPCEGDTPQSLTQAGFSTSSLPTILGNAANKVLQTAYTAYPSAARLVAKKLTASDFKTHTGLRLLGDSNLEKVGNTGELKHGKLGENSFSYAVETYGKIFGITRQMIINDDLGAFLEIPRMIGRASAATIENLFWTLVLANTGTFFGSGNKNYISGATTALSVNSLSQAVQKFREQVDENGEPLNIEPQFLVVPPALETVARQLVSSLEVRNPAAEDTFLTGNPFSGRLQVLVVPHLSNAKFTGNSATGWYLFGGPGDVAAFGIGYLNGVEYPVIEDAPLAGDMLGKAWRGYIDVGVCQIDHRGGVKSKGAA